MRAVIEEPAIIDLISQEIKLGQKELPWVFHQAKSNLDTRTTMLANINRLNRLYQKHKFDIDLSFIESHQQELASLGNTEVQEQVDTTKYFLDKLGSFLYQNRARLIVDFRLEFSVKSPKAPPSSQQVFEYIFKKYSPELAAYFGADFFWIHKDLLKGHGKEGLVDLFVSFGNFDYFDGVRPVDLGNKDSINAFYGQLIAATRDNARPELEELKQRIQGIKAVLPGAPQQGDLSKLNLRTNPDLLSELNIYAMREVFRLRAKISILINSSESIIPAFDPMEYEFADHILKNYLSPGEYQQIREKLSTFSQLPPTGFWDFFHELLGKPTRRKFLENLPHLNGNQGQNLYQVLKVIYLLSDQNSQFSKHDQPLAREMAYLIRQRLVQELDNQSNQSATLPDPNALQDLSKAYGKLLKDKIA